MVKKISGEDVASATCFHKILQGKSEKVAGTSNEDWEEMDLNAVSTI